MDQNKTSTASLEKMFKLINGFLCIVGCSILWVVLSIPLVTFGPATIALYDVILRCAKRGEDDYFKTYFASFKRHFKVGALAGTVVLLLAAALVFCIRFASGLADGSRLWYLMGYVYIAMLALLGVLASFLFPAFVHLEGKALFQIRQAVLLSLRHLFTAFTCFLVWVIAGWIVTKLAICLMFLPGLCCLVSSLVIETQFRDDRRIAEAARPPEPPQDEPPKQQP